VQRAGNNAGRGQMVRANAAQTAGACVGASVGTNFTAENYGLTGLSDEQWQTLMELLKNSKPSTNERITSNNKFDTWIIDTGASNHMTGSLMNFSEMWNVSGCPVGMPNGQSIAATKEGNVKLDGSLKLMNVLYVPNLNCILISVSQLIDESNCIVQFTYNLCVIQDRTSKMMIGAGERRDGLYFFRRIPSVKAFKIGTVAQTYGASFFEDCQVTY
jgi:hypothetical protein